MQGLWEALGGAMSSWYQAKLFLEHSVAVSNDALHVLIGALLHLLLALLMRNPLSSVRPLLVLFALILWNEAVDLWAERWPEPGMQFGEGAKDILVTMLVPTVLMFAVRLRPDLFRAKGARRR